MKTLLEIVGAPRAPAPLDRSALVLIDAQLEYLTGKLPLTGIDGAVAEAARLLELARARQVPVFHVVHHGRPGGALFDPQGPHVAVIPAVAPGDNEPVVVKALPNAFAGTDLHDRIRASGREALIVAGFATHMCVSSTVRASLDLGYRSTVIAGATATRDLPSPSGAGTVSAEALQDAALAALADRFAAIVPDAAALAEVAHASA